MTHWFYPQQGINSCSSNRTGPNQLKQNITTPDNFTKSPADPFIKLLTHRGRVMHTCIRKLATIGSDNGMSPGRRQAIIWTTTRMLLIWTLGTNVVEISAEIQTFSFKKVHLKISSGKWRPFRRGIHVSTEMRTWISKYNHVFLYVMTYPCSNFSGYTLLNLGDSKIACLCQIIEINNNKHVYRQSHLRIPNGSGVECAECSLIIGTGCRSSSSFSLILDSSVGLSAGIQSAGDSVPETLWVRILHSAEEDKLSPFDSKIACLCQSIDIKSNKHACM